MGGSSSVRTDLACELDHSIGWWQLHHSNISPRLHVCGSCVCMFVFLAYVSKL